MSWEEERHEMTLEALADVDAQRTVDHELVKLWVAAQGAVCSGRADSPTDLLD